MYAGKTVWYLPFALLTLTFVLYATVGTWFNAWISGGVRLAGANGPGGILSPETIDALYGDERLHHALLSLTEAVAQTSSNLGEQYGFAGLKEFGTNLTGELVRLKAIQVPRTRRDILSDLGNVITGGDGANATMGKMLDLLGLGGSGGGGGGLGGALGVIGNELVGGLATPALFLGIGLGVGAGTGLNLSDSQNSKEYATQVAASFNEEPTGINLVAQNLGSGLTAQLVPQFANMTDGSQIGMAAFSLAQGVGEASASGLKLTNEQAQPTNSSDIMGIARNFGLGIASPIVSRIDVQSLLGQGGGQNIMAQLPELALAAGKGLGEGARDGLGLKAQGPPPFRKRQESTDPNLPETVGQFTRGLSQAFLTQADLSKLMVTGNANIDLKSMIVPIASGAGKGIGNGAALSFGFKQDMGFPVVSGDANNSQTAELAAQEFTQGLVSMFLTNSTAVGAIVNLTMQQGQGGLAANFKPSKAAEGFARGIIEGSVNAMSSVGGFQNLLSGNFSMDAMMNLPTLAETQFDDSVNGSVVAFARGLFGEGTILASNLIRQLNKPADPNAPPPFKQKRDLKVAEAGVVPYNPVARRQDTPAQVPMVPLAIDEKTLQGIAQLSVDKLTCQGIGGLAAAALGLMNGAKMSMDMSKGVPLDNQTMAALPKGPITVMSEGNRFTVLLQDGKITINELEVLPFAVLTGLHIALTTFAFFYALPAYVIMGVIWRLSVLIGHPMDEAKNKRWRTMILVVLFLPTAVIGIIFGMVGMGKATHFRSAHDIFGLLAFIFILPTVYVTWVRLRTDVPHPSSSAFAGVKQIPKIFKSEQRVYLMSSFLIQQVLGFGQLAWIQGWTELRSISLCVVDAVLTAPAIVGLMTILLFVQVTSMALIGVRVSLEQRIAKNEAKGVSEEKKAESGDRVNRSDTMKSFGFDNQPEPFKPQERPPLVERNTGQLLGREDSQIGWPSDVRKYGEDGMDADRNNPFLSPREQGERERGRTYDPKLGGYVEAEGPDYPNIFSDPIISPDNIEPKDRKYSEDTRDTQFRPSSELDPDSRYQSSYYAPQSPVMPAKEDVERMPVQRFESFSRPLGRNTQNTTPNGRPS